MLTYAVYIIYSEKLDRFYVDNAWGDLDEALKRHNTGGSIQTINGAPWILIWHTDQFSVQEGAAFIGNLRRMSRSRFIRALKKAGGNYPGKGLHPSR